ncbi:putative photosynthetic complex assembly protein [Roseibium hamelinense]|uniref:Putative photosynthetic complex assembly protein n=1 Tax=Roseibium hamelinense TaxID=150831 RepID=A0A562SXD8_9HYPH|nr:photosynthetic complex assembly protein PuhC [Roseibium hamelinense]MTI44857.1 phosphonoacetaldehyde hydrolase [Roseibium hamelinense]TWI85949.1 putative photosynthetic complex assembly protein [Roseibium hamelinense]
MAKKLSYGSLDRKPKRRIVRFPVLPLYAAFTLIGLAVTATVFGTVTGIGTVKDTFGQPTAIRDIIITGSVSEPVYVYDARTGDLIQSFEVQDGGFVRGSLRALARLRLVKDADQEAPYRLIRWENGVVSLSDTVSGERIYLNAFGPDNAAAFAALLDRTGGSRT